MKKHNCGKQNRNSEHLLDFCQISNYLKLDTIVALISNYHSRFANSDRRDFDLFENSHRESLYSYIVLF